jgi:uncharacterized membrane protein
MGRRLLHFIRTTLVGGILFLVPIVVLIVILDKALEFAHRFSDPLAARFPVLAVHTPILLATLLLVVVCFLLGLLARVGPAQMGVAWLEKTILSKLPGYAFLKGAGESVLGHEGQAPYPVVLARIEDAWQFGFVIEKLAGGHLAVFVPDAPNPLSGSVYLMGPDRVRHTEIPVAAALKCLRQLGAGAHGRLPNLDWH